MPPQAQPTQAPQPDLQALALTKAIRQRETGGNYSAVGDAGTSTGAYQFQPDTWKAYAKQALGDSNAPMTEENQNAVTYSMIKTWKDQGLGPAQIAAKWNHGSETGWENLVGSKNINGKQVGYNTPQYVKDVVDNFQKIYPQVSQQYGAPESSNPLIPTASADMGGSDAPATPQQDALTKLTNFFNTIFPGKQVGEAIGTLAGYGISKAKGTSDYYDTSAPSVGQVLGDVAQGALTVGAGMPEGTAISAFGKEVPAALPVAKSVLGRIAGQTALGAGFGLTGGIADGKGIGDILHQTGTSALIGGALGTTAEGVTKLFNSLPNYIAKGALKINPKTLEGKPGLIDQALNDIKFGTKSQMEQTSQGLLNKYKNTIQSILTSPDYEGIVLDGKEAAKIVTEQFADSNISAAQVAKTVKQVAPEAAGLVDRFVTEGLDLADANRLRSLVDTATNSFYTRNSVPPFSKKVAVGLADVLRNAIQEGAPETKPIFEKYTREIPIHAALQRIQKAPTLKVGMKDLLLNGFGHLLGLPAVPAFLGEEIASNPTVQLNAAKAIKKTAPLATGAVKAATLPTMTATSR